MNWKWISFGILCLVLLFQYKNISSFIAVELALKGFKELDVNSDDVIDKSEWPGTVSYTHLTLPTILLV